MKPRCLDLFCGAGGAGMGLHQAGFDVVGVDINRQPRYPFEFHQADAMTYPLDGFDFIWASPPCQKYTSMKTMPNARDDHPDLVVPIRNRLMSAVANYVIENVPGAPLARGSIMLCGTMFGLGVPAAAAELRRHRWFETSTMLLAPQCNHKAILTIGSYGDHGVGPNTMKKMKRMALAGEISRPVRPRTVGVWGNAGGTSKRDGVQQFTTAERSEAMGINWMIGSELSEAIPPAYSKWIGEQMIVRLRGVA